MPSATDIFEATRDRESTGTEARDRHDAIRKIGEIRRQVQKHCDITFNKTGAASEQQTKDLLTGLRELEGNPGDTKILERWDGFIEWSEKAIASALKLEKTLQDTLNEAVEHHWISASSRTKWMQRFKDSSVEYRKKEYWIEHQLPSYAQAWKDVALKRKKIASDPGFSALLQWDERFAILKNEKENAFLALHFDARRDLIKEAESTMAAARTLELSLHSEARKKLQSAIDEKILSPTKKGAWLERIFDDKVSMQSRKAFVEGTGNNSLSSLIENWRLVKTSFDELTAEAKSRGEESAIRGFHPLSESQFLGLHFSTKLRYVDDLRKRLKASEDIDSEHPTLITIRHEMDSGDWEAAEDALLEALTDTSITGEDRTQLLSMERTIRIHLKSAPSGNPHENLYAAKHRIDVILRGLRETHAPVVPMIMSLLKDSMANRSLHQLRWMVYNHKWCRSHGFLNRNIARRGASEECEDLTRERARKGEDIGLHDTMSHTTADHLYIRKNEKANHKATYRHIDLQDGVTLQKNAEWLKREQDPRVLYWTTTCFHEDGEPRSDQWHDDLLAALTELRSLTRTLKNGNAVYAGEHERLMQRGASYSALTIAG